MLIMHLKGHLELRAQFQVLEKGRTLYVGHLQNLIAGRNAFRSLNLALDGESKPSPSLGQALTFLP